MQPHEPARDGRAEDEVKVGLGLGLGFPQWWTVDHRDQPDRAHEEDAADERDEPGDHERRRRQADLARRQQLALGQLDEAGRKELRGKLAPSVRCAPDPCS